MRAAQNLLRHYDARRAANHDIHVRVAFKELTFGHCVFIFRYPSAAGNGGNGGNAPFQENRLRRPRRRDW
jgi:hypothetical protein